ncbi:MAG TPA: hypothetical protein VD927_05960 [Chryseosolibacter sp.]|nr:hypothetical protein [Chryseosolibacter sp.]
MRLIFLSIILLLSGCDKIEDLLTFNVSDTVSLTIPKTTILNLPVNLSTPDITTSAKQEFSNNNTRADLVKDVKLTELSMDIKSPDGQTFSFLKSIHIYISTDGNDELLLASLENIPMDVTSVNLTPTTEKLDRFLKSDTYRLRTTTVYRETFSEDIDLEIYLNFKVTADPL